MFVLVSPAKKLNNDAINVNQPTIPVLLGDSEKLIVEVKKKSAADLKKLMGISDKLAELNVKRFQEFSTPFTTVNAKPAIHFFAGDTYIGLNSSTMDDADIEFAQMHLGILSGLYGLLRPKDLMQAYRLEMGTKMKNGRGKNLYEFWGERITKQINKHLNDQKEATIINLASKEYFSSVAVEKLVGKVITPIFKERRKGILKIISFSAKRARGSMARYIILNRIENCDDIKKFSEDGYVFTKELSDEHNWVFVR
jgi:uncharacterized protein